MPGDDFIWDYSNSNPEVVSVELIYEGQDQENENIFRFRFTGVSKGEAEVRLLHKKKDEELVDGEQIFRVIVNENREVTLM